MKVSSDFTVIILQRPVKTGRPSIRAMLLFSLPLSVIIPYIKKKGQFMQFSRVNNWLVKEKLDEVITQAHAEKYQLAPRMRERQ